MKNVAILGGTSGIGYETAKIFLKEGHRVFIIGRTQHKLQRALMKLRTIGDVTGKLADIKQEEDIKRVVGEIMTWGTPEFMVLSAGEGVFTELRGLRVEDYRAVMDSEVLGKLLFLREVLGGIERETLDVVIIGSTLSYEGIPESSVYVAAKHAVKGLVESLREEFFHKAWRFMFLAPDDVRTDFLPKTTKPRDKLIEPEDLAQFIYQLSELPSSLTPSEIIIHGRIHDTRE